MKYLMMTTMILVVAFMTGCFASAPTQKEEDTMESEDWVEDWEEEEELNPIEDDSTENEQSLSAGNIKFNESDYTLNYTIENIGSSEITHGASYAVYRMNGFGNWEESVYTKGMVFDMMARILKPGETATESVDISIFRDKIGTYKVSKTYMIDNRRFDVHATFSVDEFLNYDYFELTVE